jgi:hypothetical protein
MPTLSAGTADDLFRNLLIQDGASLFRANAAYYAARFSGGRSW